MVTWTFRVLGPLDVTGPRGAVRLNSSRERTILAVLALNANRLVAAQRLVDAIWAEAPPAMAREQIYICISHLRRALARAGLPDRIATRHPGYLLRVLQDELDLHAFEQRVDAATSAAKSGRPVGELATVLHSALEVFPGEPFADVDSQLVRSAAVHLLERRMSVVEERIDAETRMNLHHEVLDELAALVAEYPLRERLRALQMIALHRAGRRAEALAAYQ